MLPRHLYGMSAEQLSEYYGELCADIHRCNHQFNRMVEINPSYAYSHEQAHHRTILDWRHELRSIDRELGCD